MKQLIVPLFCWLILSCSSSDPIHPTTDSQINLAYDEFNKILSPSSITPLSADESLTLLRRPEDQYAKIYKLDHNTQQYTLQLDYGRNISRLFSDPWYQHIYLYIDNNGDEQYGIYQYDPVKKTITSLFVNAGFQATLVNFSRHKQHIFIRSNHENKKIYSIYQMDIKTKQVTRLTKGEKSWDDALISPDEKYMALIQAKGNNESHLYWLETATGNIKELHINKNTVYNPAFFHPNQNTLFLTSDHNRDRSACFSLSLDDPQSLNIMRSDQGKDLSCYYDPMADITFVYQSYDGKTAIQLLKGVFGKELNTPIPDKVISSQFSILPDKDTAFVKLLQSNSPGNFYQFKLSAGKQGQLTAITQANQSSIAEDEFAKSYDFHYQSYDGKNIHAIIYAKPAWLTDGVQRPLIVWPHGGPDSHMRHVYLPYIQYWALNGYVVLAPNFRGSTGYGKAFETLNDKDWGGGHIKDLIWGKNALKQQNYIDDDRIYIVGASFGGYSVLSAITQYPQEFDGAVAMLAISNLFTFLKSIPPDPAWQTEFLTEMGDPIVDKALYKSRSPYFHADKIQIPLKIYQAENDTRTVKAEMDQFVAKLNELHIPVEYEILENEGHGISRKETAQKLFQGTIEFLNATQN